MKFVAWIIVAACIALSAYVGWLVAGFWGWMVGIAPNVVVGIIWWLFGQEE